MTQETKQFVDFSDILGLEFKCPKCGASTTHSLAEFKNLPRWCQNCNVELVKENSRDAKAVYAFVDALREIAKTEYPVRLEVSCHAEKK